MIWHIDGALAAPTQIDGALAALIQIDGALAALTQIDGALAAHTDRWCLGCTNTDSGLLPTQRSWILFTIASGLVAMPPFHDTVHDL